MSENTNRARRAAMFAETLIDAGCTDAADLDSSAWNLAARLHRTHPASDATRAMTVAILDVIADRERPAFGGKDERIAYNIGRRAASAARIIVSVATRAADANDFDDKSWAVAGAGTDTTREAAKVMFFPLFVGLRTSAS